MTLKIKTVYLAGPDVFHPKAEAIGRHKKKLCADRWLEGLFPLDNEVAFDARAIRNANIAMMRRADCGVFNLTPFRGPSADAGTVFELGFMEALDKPCFGYSNKASEYRKRVHCSMNKKTGRWTETGSEGLAVEDFGIFDNLMIPFGLERVARPRLEDDESADRWHLWHFVECLDAIVNWNTYQELKTR